MRCYNEEVDFEIEDLGKDEWLTGCPLCGDSCWERDKSQRDRIDAELDKQEEEAK